jgi:hypothetical protein
MKNLRNAALILASLAVAILLGCASTSSPTSLVDSLSSGLGISADQAAGGVGSVLNYAQTKLEPMDYQKVANTIPGASHYIQKAADLGATTGPITDRAGLSASLSKLGLSPETGTKLTQEVVKYVDKMGGKSVKGLLYPLR